MTVFYSIKATKKDEKELIQKINDYLKGLLRSLSKTKGDDKLNRDNPHLIKHYYWNLNKDTGTYFEIFPNEDLQGAFFDAGNKDCGWIFKTIYHIDRPGYEKDRSEAFINDVLKSTGFSFAISNIA